jgi:hypothetical protein
MKTSKSRKNKAYKKGAWKWLYSRMETCVKKGSFDASDAGMILYMLTGVEKTNPELVKSFMENSIKK